MTREATPPEAAGGEEAAVYGLFEVVGLEIEYMVVDADTLDVRPVVDRVLEAVAGERTNEAEVGALEWSNELAMHVLEMKTAVPAPAFQGLVDLFDGGIERALRELQPLGCTLLPTAMHPWMHPDSEFRLWPWGNREIYDTFDRIFDCRGHGWSNLQSIHINLPFDGDEEFARLHDAVRLVLPLIPALAASSPFQEGLPTSCLDTRLSMYGSNSRRVPSVAGVVVPERVESRAEYERVVLAPIYRDLRALDPEGILAHEWINGRGAIARFDRSAIEIRITDTQECARADLAVAAAVTAAVRSLVEREIRGADFGPERLVALLARTIRDADAAVFDDPAYVELFGLRAGAGATPVMEVWQAIAGGSQARTVLGDELGPVLRAILRRGSLSRAVLAATGPAPDRSRLRETYRELAACLAADRLWN
jgi:carboxylate-amine ligase